MSGEYYYSTGVDSSLSTYYNIIMAVGLILGMLQIIGLWRIFEKAGKPGWYSIIPILNVYTLYEITWGNGWMFLLNLLIIIPIIGSIIVLVVSIMTCSKLSHAFGEGTGFTLGLIFLEPIFIILLGFSNREYSGILGQVNTNYNIPKSDPMINNNMNTQTTFTPNMNNPQLASNQTPQAPQTPVQYCKNCGVQLNPGAKFCQVCGAQTNNQQ